MTYYPVIGLEVHVQLNTKTKLFCRCLNEYSPDEPNKNICEFCTGQPGALPTLNQEAVKKALRFGVAINANIPEKTRWDRKNYFYPDLPAGYQISQYDNPIIEGGVIEFFVEDKNGKDFVKHKVNLTRAHLEADAGKLLHVGEKTLVDYNRSGAPLIEIVSEPEMESSSQAMAYVQELQQIVRTLGISDGDMEKGQMRFDCNLSLRNQDELESKKLPGYKVEIKNINSIRALGRAIEYEIQRQTELLEKGQTPAQETRGWRDDLNKSTSQRSKEEAHDYRYFPEPDLQILLIREEDKPKVKDLSELPIFKRQKYLDQGLTLQNANTFVSQSNVGNLYDSTILFAQSKATIDNPFDEKLQKFIANIITTNLLGLSIKQEKEIDKIINPEQIIDLTKLFFTKKINNQGLSKAIDILSENNNQKVEQVVKDNGLLQVTDDSALLAFVELVLKNNPLVVKQYKEGKIQIIGFLVGQCMKESKGKGNPARFKELLEEKLAIV